MLIYGHWIHWILQILLHENQKMPIHQEDVKENFRQTIKIDTDGCYEVLLPWKDNHLPLVDNKNSAVKQLETTTRKLRA